MQSTFSKGILAAVFTIALTGAGFAQHDDEHGKSDKHDKQDKYDKESQKAERKQDHEQNKSAQRNDRLQQNEHYQNEQAYRFRPEDRDQFRGHYQANLNRYQIHPDQRRQWLAGQQLSYTDIRRFQPVPRNYYRDIPPPGYRLGYYDGNVYAYNPTTRIIADVLDLVTR